MGMWEQIARRDMVRGAIEELRAMGFDIEATTVDRDTAYRLHEPARAHPDHDAQCACRKPA